MKLQGNATLYYLVTAWFVACHALCSCTSRQDFSSESDSLIIEKDTICIYLPPEDETIREVTIFRNQQEAFDYMNQSPDSGKYAAGILPRMAEEVPEYCYRLLNNTHPRFIVADKRRMKVILYDCFGREEKIYGMACAKNYGTKHKKGDSRTPEGFFTAQGVHDSTDWLFTDDDGVTSPIKGQFGPRYIRLLCPVSRQIGIHGTGSPWTIGGRRSHGCMRLTNESIMELVEYVEPGMPVIVSPGKRDMIVNLIEGYDVPAVSTSSLPQLKVTDFEIEQERLRIEEEKEKVDTLKNTI